MSNVGGSPSSGAGDRDRDAAAGRDRYGALWRRLDLHSPDTDLHSKRRARPGGSYPEITVTASVGANVAPGTVTNTAVVAGGGDTNTGNNTATDPTVITSPVSGGDLALTKTHSGGASAGADNHVHPEGHKRRQRAGERHGHRDRGAAAGPDITALSGAGWTCILATRTCLRADALAPTMSYPTSR